MTQTVGITGATGNVGAAALKYLILAASAGKIKLVIFHRPETQPKLSVTSDIELRSLNFEDPVSEIKKAISGINIFISAVAFEALPYESRVIEAFAASKDLAVYMPSTYSTTWDSEDHKDATTGRMLDFVHGGLNKARELELPLTTVYTGVFENYFFGHGLIIPPIKQNTIRASKEQLKHRIPITVVDHLGHAIASLASSDPTSIANKEFSILTFQPTGEELVELYSQINGKQAAVKDYTSAFRKTLMDDEANFGSIKAGYFDKWQKDSYAYEGPNRQLYDQHYKAPSIRDVAERFA